MQIRNLAFSALGAPALLLSITLGAQRPETNQPSTRTTAPKNPAYALTDLGGADDHSPLTVAVAINNKGQAIVDADAYTEPAAPGQNAAGLGSQSRHAATCYLYEAGKYIPLAPATEVWALNSHADLIGCCDTGDTGSDCQRVPYLTLKGKQAKIPGLSSLQTFVKIGDGTVGTAINSRGDYVGFVETGLGGRSVTAGFLFRGGKLTILGALGGSQSSAFDVNESGDVVGKADTREKDSHHAFLYRNGRMTDLGTFGGGNSKAEGINSVGQICGYAQTQSGRSHAFLYAQGKMMDLGTVGVTPVDSYAYGINRGGQVVGAEETIPSDGSKPQEVCAFLDTDGRMVDLNSCIPPGSGWKLTTARGINDRSQIVGQGIYKGKPRAFLLTPR